MSVNAQPAWPPLDPELAAARELFRADVGAASVTSENLSAVRRRAARVAPSLGELSLGGTVQVDWTCAAVGGTRLPVLVLRPRATPRDAPAICHFHSGGMVMGDARTGVEVPLSWAVRFGAVVLSVEYRLAPEFPDPVPREDCYAALVWIGENAGALGIDSRRILLAGASAGGGLAAGVALLVRDRGGPPVLGQALMCPMLDDRNETPSSYGGPGDDLWNRTSNLTGWTALLGDRRGGPDVSPYAAPSRAVDLSGLPPTFIDVGACEIFRDEAVSFADRLWRAGTHAELHVWPGGFHAFDTLVPQAALSMVSTRTRAAWVGRLLASA